VGACRHRLLGLGSGEPNPHPNPDQVRAVTACARGDHAVLGAYLQGVAWRGETELVQSRRVTSVEAGAIPSPNPTPGPNRNPSPSPNPSPNPNPNQVRSRCARWRRVASRSTWRRATCWSRSLSRRATTTWCRARARARARARVRVRVRVRVKELLNPNPNPNPKP